jgi:non-ribosomal peptide synthase protein (TIGR01720 family)
VRRDGEWRQDFAPSQSHQPPLRVVNLHADARDQYQARVVEESEREQAAMRLAEGNLFRCVLFEGLGEWRRLLLVAHHLVVDAVSWNLILDDLARLVARAVSGESLKLPDHSASARQWALTLAAQATTLTAAASANYWLAMPSRENDLPPGISAVTKAHHRDVVRDAELLSIAFNAAHTRSLLKEAPRRLHATPHAILLAGVLLAWYRSGGGETLRLDVEAHGRDLPGIGLDVSRTVGWFTTVFPLELALPPSIANVEPSALAIVKAVQSVLDSVPLRGAAHGLQRYLSADTTTRARLAAMPRRTVLFNFLGAHDVAFESASGLIVSDEPRGRSRDPAAPRAYALELNSLVERGTLILSIEYSRVLHRKHAVQAFADRCREAFDAIAGTTTSGFGLAGFDGSTLSTVAALLDTEERA